MEEKTNHSGKKSKRAERRHQLQIRQSWHSSLENGSSFLSRPLYRVFPRGDSDIRAAAKFGSSVTVRLRELTGGLETSN